MPNLLLVLLTLAASAPPAHAGPVPDGDRQTALKLAQALAAGDKDAVSKLLSYPVTREKPLAPLADAKQFIEHYGEFFDAKTIADIQKGAAGDLFNNWQGTAVGAGLVWISDGKITALTVRTDRQKALAAAARGKDSAQVYFDCATKRHFVRIDDSSGQVRYRAWKAGASLADPPDLTLTGKRDAQGSGGNTVYTFESHGYSYEVDQTVVCGEDCDSKLIVSRAGKTLSTDTCLAAQP